jgi:hypothetical protein
MWIGRIGAARSVLSGNGDDADIDLVKHAKLDEQANDAG